MKKETKRMILSIAGVIAFLLIAWTMKPSLMTGDVGLENLKATAKVVYVPLEPTFVSGGTLMIAEPSFSGASTAQSLVRTGLTCCLLVLVGVGLLSYQENARKLERQHLKQNKE